MSSAALFHNRYSTRKEQHMIRLLAAALVTILSTLPATQAAEIKATFIRATKSPLSNPHDLKLSPDGRRLFVSDVGHNRIVILDAMSLTERAAFGADHQSGTHDIDFDKNGTAYVADTHNNRVVTYAMTGNVARQIGEIKGGFRGPEGVLAHPNGLIYIAGAWSNNLVAFKDGKAIAELNELSSPHDVEMTAEGDIWLSDAGNNRMLLLTPDLKIKRELKGQPYAFNGVRYQDVRPDGTVIAADKNSHRVLVISKAGTIRLILGDGKRGLGPNQFATPEGVDSRGNYVWISDSGNDRVVLYQLVGL
jgi:DNA-binding beta-propeller fold protein YncE